MPSRRAVLLLAVGAATAGCAADPASAPSSSATVVPPRSATPSPSVQALPAVTRWQPDGNDISPAAKVAAVRRIERTGNTASSALQVIEAQYGGILTDSASVLVVTRSWTRQGSRIMTAGRTYDVRLTRSGRTWRVTQINPSRPGRATPSPSGTARKVLVSDRIDLPPAARRDVASGQVHDSVLHAMLRVASAYQVGISVIRSGHPLYVFGTDRRSDHPQGRAFDTWRINGHAVVDARTSKALVTDYMHEVTDAGSYNTGGPYLLGSAPQWFSDNTHHDHVHAGFAD